MQAVTVQRLPEAEELQRELSVAYARIRHLEMLALTDPLTRLANRRAFDARIVEEFSRATRSTSALSLAILDLDHFKRRNDAFGHQAGDGCLILLASVLLANSRQGDTVARIGGEEFAMILPSTDAAQAGRLLRRIATALRLDPCVGGPLTFSAGVVQSGEDGVGPADLIRLADTAMYAAKRDGRDRIVVRL